MRKFNTKVAATLGAVVLSLGVLVIPALAETTALGGFGMNGNMQSFMGNGTMQNMQSFMGSQGMNTMHNSASMQEALTTGDMSKMADAMNTPEIKAIMGEENVKQMTEFMKNGNMQSMHGQGGMMSGSYEMMGGYSNRAKPSN